MKTGTFWRSEHINGVNVYREGNSE